MLTELFPRAHARYAALTLIGPYLEGLVEWLHRNGFPRGPIRARVGAARRLEKFLLGHGVSDLRGLTEEELYAYAASAESMNTMAATLLRSLARYLGEAEVLASRAPTPQEVLLGQYRSDLLEVRGFAPLTVGAHVESIGRLLVHLRYDDDPACLQKLDQQRIQAFVETESWRLSRETLQHVVARVRAFLRYLEARGIASVGLAQGIDTARVYRGERLPKALPWTSVRAVLTGIDRSTSKGLRDYAMILLIVTYGLRSGEVAALTLDDINWRARRLDIPCTKTQSGHVLPLTEEVGDALAAYLRDARPRLAYRQVFLRVRSPAGPVERTVLGKMLKEAAHRSALPRPWPSPHCLRHSLAVHLLREGIPLKAIGDLLGHRSAEATCVYLRLHIEDLREVALGLPSENAAGVQP